MKDYIVKSEIYIPRWVYSALKWVLLIEASAATALVIDWWWAA